MSQTLKLLAESSLRGVSVSDIALEILDIRSVLRQEPSLVHVEFLNYRLQWLIKELEHRRTLNTPITCNPDNELLQTIKERAVLEDVIGWYTDVYYSNRDQLKFRCTLHGEDKHPSGIIYRKERRWHCFGCNAHGDVFDAVQRFERTGLREAIKKLANYLGIEIRPLVETRERDLDFKPRHRDRL